MPPGSIRDSVMSVSAPPIYVYGIVRAGSQPRFAEGPARGGTAELGRPRLLPCGDLAAIVGDLVLPNGASLDDLLREARQAEQLVLAHHRVLEAAAGGHTVLPLRFGAVFVDDEGVLRALKQNHSVLLGALSRIDGALEWGLKICCDRRRLGARLAGEIPAIAELEAEIVSAAEGKAFFLRRRLERLTRGEVEQAIARCVTHSTERLRGAVRAFAPGRIQPAEVHGRESDMVFNGAYLVARGSEQGFFNLVEDLRGAYAGFGFDYERSGPWPPYGFADCRLGSDGHGA